MPAISAPANILVTGASGFLAASCCQALLRRGFNVYGTVRSHAKGEYLKKLFENEPNGTFAYIIVEDMRVLDACDEAVKTMDAVLHLASPVTGIFGPDVEPEDAFRPAINGTLGILESAKKNGSTVKRIVITSSMSAVAGLKDTNWNQAAVDEVNKIGKAAQGFVKYSASKVLAERAAWDFMEKYGGGVGFDIVTVCPAWIAGPNIQEEGVSASNQYMLGPLDPKNRKTGSELTAGAGSCSDVRDIANVHAELLMKPGAGGERFIASGTPFAWKDVYEALDVPFEASTEESGPLAAADQTKLVRIMEKPLSDIFRPLPETMRDAVKSARERGWDVKLN
ncbi:methylglyoxal reductase (NADPH-dependent) gre2 [Tulasnella sp. 332]|nr:methylglyoxal reductase (NADPH-dependent) gre2 [Tulasnella sp. 332]